MSYVNNTVNITERWYCDMYQLESLNGIACLASSPVMFASHN